MSKADLPIRSPLSAYQRQAFELDQARRAGNEDAEWRFKWEHPQFRGKSIDDVREASLDLNDAKVVIARDYGFHTWGDLVTFTEAMSTDTAVARFEEAADAVVAGDLAKLRLMLEDNPELVRERSTRRHHATLLHYLGANGVEDGRQKTPPNAQKVAKLLLETGAEPDALADMYDKKCTTMSMLVSSSHPHEAGLQTVLAETLLDHGAKLEGAGTVWQSPVLTALQFGYSETAQVLARRYEAIDDLVIAAGLGRLDEAKDLLPQADAAKRHAALALAAHHSETEVVRLLLDAGEDPNRFNPDGFHTHSTPLHQAALANRLEVVELLVERGAKLDIKDKIYQGTPRDWAIHAGNQRMADFLGEAESKSRASQ